MSTKTEKDYGPPHFQGQAAGSKESWNTWEFKFTTYIDSKECSEPLTTPRPPIPANNAGEVVRERYRTWISANAKGFGYLVQAMAEVPEAITMLQLRVARDQADGNLVRSALEALQLPYQPQTPVHIETLRETWRSQKLDRGESLAMLVDKLLLLQARLTGAGAVLTVDELKARLTKALQNGEKDLNVLIATLNANPTLTYEWMQEQCVIYSSTEMGMERIRTGQRAVLAIGEKRKSR
jgi:hypothetical protein